MNCEECKLEERVTALEKDSERNQGTHREFYGKFEAIAVQSALTDERYNAITATLSEIKKDLGDLKAKPGKRWEGIVDKALWAVAGAFLAWLLTGAPGL